MRSAVLLFCCLLSAAGGEDVAQQNVAGFQANARDSFEGPEKRFGSSNPLMYMMKGKHYSNGRPTFKGTSVKRQVGLVPLLHGLPGKRGGTQDDSWAYLLHNMPGKRMDSYEPMLHSIPGKRQGLGGPLLHSLPGKRTNTGLEERQEQEKRNYYYNPLLHSMPGKKEYMSGPLLHNVMGKRYDPSQYGPMLHAIPMKKFSPSGPLLHNIPGKKDTPPVDENDVKSDGDGYGQKRYDGYGPVLHSMPGKKNSVGIDSVGVGNQNAAVEKKDWSRNPILHSVHGKRDPYYRSSPILHAIPGKKDESVVAQEDHWDGENEATGRVKRSPASEEEEEEEEGEDEQDEDGDKRSGTLLQYMRGGQMRNSVEERQPRYGFWHHMNVYMGKRPAYAELPLLHQLLGYIGKRNQEGLLLHGPGSRFWKRDKEIADFDIVKRSVDSQEKRYWQGMPILHQLGKRSGSSPYDKYSTKRFSGQTPILHSGGMFGKRGYAPLLHQLGWNGKRYGGVPILHRLGMYGKRSWPGPLLHQMSGKRFFHVPYFTPGGPTLGKRDSSIGEEKRFFHVPVFGKDGPTTGKRNNGDINNEREEKRFFHVPVFSNGDPVLGKRQDFSDANGAEYDKRLYHVPLFHNGKLLFGKRLNTDEELNDNEKRFFHVPVFSQGSPLLGKRMGDLVDSEKRFFHVPVFGQSAVTIGKKSVGGWTDVEDASKRQFNGPILHQGLFGKRFMDYPIFGRNGPSLGKRSASDDVTGDVGGEKRTFSVPILHRLGRFGKRSPWMPILHQTAIPGKRFMDYPIFHKGTPLTSTYGKRFMDVPLFNQGGPTLGKRNQYDGEESLGDAEASEYKEDKRFFHYPVFQSNKDGPMVIGKRSTKEFMNQPRSDMSVGRMNGANPKLSNPGPLLNVITGKRHGYGQIPLLHGLKGKKNLNNAPLLHVMGKR